MTGWSFVVPAVLFTLGWVLGRRETCALDEQLDAERDRADRMAEALFAAVAHAWYPRGGDDPDWSEALSAWEAHRSARSSAQSTTPNVRVVRELDDRG